MIENEKQQGLPKGWIQSDIVSAANVILGQSPPSSTYNVDGIGLPFFQGKTEFGELYPKAKKWCDTPKKIAEKGDILISVRAPVGPTNICPAKACIGRGLAAIRPKGEMGNLFFIYYLRSTEHILSGQGTGTTFNSVTGNILKSFPIPLSPLPEQGRIVAKIEELFSDLDAGVAALEKVRAEIKRYRQAVLKHAFEGKLTAKWRQKNKDKIEPASKLLERIKAEREKLPKRRKCKVLSLESDAFSIIPDGWGAAILNEYCLDVKDGTHDTPKYIDKGIPFVTQKNIRLYGLDMLNTKYISKADHDDFHRRSNVEKNDIIISMIGANRGMSCIVNTDEVFSIKNVGLLKPFLNLNNLKYLGYYIKSQLAQKIILARSRGGAQQFIGLTELRSWAIIIPPLPEQEQIVSEVERRFSIADNAEKIVEQALKQAGRLRQSILKRAFEGKLVPQDPNDEPAEKLLERIKAEKKKSG